MNPTPVAVCVVIHEDEILLLVREKGIYAGYYSLPGGKIEHGEHVSETAVRELEEETGVKSEFLGYRGIVCEHLIENGEVDGHYLLHICLLRPLTFDLSHSEEGKAEWVKLSELDDLKLVESDQLMITKMVQGNERFLECTMEKKGDTYELVRKLFK